MRGYVRQDGSSLRLEVLTDDPVAQLFADTEAPSPASLFGATTKGSIFIPSANARGRKTNIGGNMASVRQFSSRSAIFGLPDLSSRSICRVSINVPGLTGWAGLEVEKDRIELDQEKKVRSLEVHYRGGDHPPSRIKAGTIHMRASWDSEGGARSGTRIIRTSLEVTVSSSSIHSADVLAKPLLAVVRLFLLAFNGWVDVPWGTAEDTAGGRGAYWSGDLMVKPGEVPSAKVTEMPFFTLADLNGLRGVARWIDICDSHPRAVEPVVRPFISPRAPEENITSCCQGIEYWVGAHAAKKPTERLWARRGLKGHAKVTELITHVGERKIRRMVGDVDIWASALWHDYNELKHNPGARLDIDRARTMALSARILLQVALLREASGNQAIVARYLNDHRLQGLADQIKQIL